MFSCNRPYFARDDLNEHAIFHPQKILIVETFKKWFVIFVLHCYTNVVICIWILNNKDFYQCRGRDGWEESVSWFLCPPTPPTFLGYGPPQKLHGNNIGRFPTTTLGVIHVIYNDTFTCHDRISGNSLLTQAQIHILSKANTSTTLRLDLLL